MHQVVLPKYSQNNSQSFVIFTDVTSNEQDFANLHSGSNSVIYTTHFSLFQYQHVVDVID